MRNEKENPAQRGSAANRAGSKLDTLNITRRRRVRKPLAPYSRQLDQSHRSVAIVTGDAAWGVARAGTFHGRSLLLLPAGADPLDYAWPISGRDCIVFSFGKPEQRRVLVRLSVELIQSGAPFVIWCIPGDLPATRFVGGLHG